MILRVGSGHIAFSGVEELLGDSPLLPRVAAITDTTFKVCTSRFVDELVGSPAGAAIVDAVAFTTRCVPFSFEPTTVTLCRNRPSRQPLCYGLRRTTSTSFERCDLVELISDNVGDLVSKHVHIGGRRGEERGPAMSSFENSGHDPLNISEGRCIDMGRLSVEVTIVCTNRWSETQQHRQFPRLISSQLHRSPRCRAGRQDVEQKCAL